MSLSREGVAPRDITPKYILIKLEQHHHSSLEVGTVGGIGGVTMPFELLHT
jgi:hypothetical protein